ncbi:hypothetical protein PUR34_09675 [Streptomyces sp. JV185]|uniref:hypothetical protein n=1 Tax=Streptomyces sp. JV185 TaxID=858638 RepID=UPI002E7850C0|nr:hypothetical protein [Streptomyces sp. JV185]MEE1768425.1 hypothetical protein [Streptomyces sp. JV185]
MLEVCRAVGRPGAAGGERPPTEPRPETPSKARDRAPRTPRAAGTAGVVLSTSAIGHRLGVLPRPLTVPGTLVGLTLLFVSGSLAWSEPAFPLWAPAVGVHILVRATANPSGGR